MGASLHRLGSDRQGRSRRWGEGRGRVIECNRALALSVLTICWNPFGSSDYFQKGKIDCRGSRLHLRFAAKKVSVSERRKPVRRNSPCHYDGL